ncbi:carboxypeptidase regulatory-like domain-containing protein [Hymenobacter fodinae]|uniref:carboxypeptidase regulatory-like domain-containing protein n=1 Tax=Hymenobacter fodinae TaxID=2510796 RepID=UPI001FDA76A2|nr:carboxypeptidase regulatory-like domain-containing protein [Hymenobacter fodinae]
MRYFLLILCCLVISTAWAQKPAAPATGKAQILGAVADSATGKPLREASISLLAGRDSSYLSFTITDGDGRFTLRNVGSGRYFLLVTFLGYKSQLHPVNVGAGGLEVPVGTLRLRAMAQSWARWWCSRSGPP